MNGCKVDVGGEGLIFKYVCTKLESKTYLSRRVVSIMLTSGVQNCNRALEQMIQCIVLAVAPPLTSI